jgi:hypothetical protein
MIPATHAEIEPGKYSISTTGSVFSSRNDLQKKIDSKAEKLCGLDNYGYEGLGEFDKSTMKTYVNGSFMDVTSLHLKRIATCTESKS